MINPIYLDALNALTTELKNRGIYYEVNETTGNGFVVSFTDDWNVTISDYTNGSKYGLWESFGHPDDNDDITSCIGIERIMKRFSIGFDEWIWFE